MDRQKIFLSGATDIVPLIIGAIPFGLIVGVTSASLGLDALESTAASAVIFAGAAQLATYDLLGQNAPWLVVAATAILINLRFMLYSAALSSTFAEEAWWKRAAYSYLLTDQVYALSASRSLREPNAHHAGAYYFGAAVSMWLMWMTTTFIGSYAGAAIPASWSLEFAVPLCFIALLIPAIRDRAQLLCALITAVAALLTRSAPHGSGTIISIIIGIAAGAVLARRLK